MKLLEEYWRTLILLYSVEGRETSEVKTKSALRQGFPLPPHTNVSSQKGHGRTWLQVITFVVCKQMMDFKINPPTYYFIQKMSRIL